MLAEKGLSNCALILAAGTGTRMRPLTDKIPKPLILLAGTPLVDHVIARLVEADIERIAVNLHYLADNLEDHLKSRTNPAVMFSDERAQILDSGYGAKRMLNHVGNKPFLLANADTVWLEGSGSNMLRLVETWDAAKMDILLLLASSAESIGLDGKGDFTRDDQGRLARRRGESAPFTYAGFAILRPELFADTPDMPFSLNLLFDRAIAKGRLYGLPLEGTWMHVGTPQALAEAEALLASVK